MRRLAVLGSTGSIGRATLDVVATYPERFAVVALAAGRNLSLVREQARRHRPELVAVAAAEDARVLAAELPDIRVVAGPEGLVEVACVAAADTVVAALVGSLGLESTLAAIRAGKRLALANKETLVVAGELVMREVAAAGVELLPIDSEHNAVHQALRVGPSAAVEAIILTASGGPFRSWSAERIAAASVADALAHPTWRMGAKISVDSATLMNKGLEIIEACHLFGVPEERVKVVVHPQSLVHSLVEYVDGSLIAQLSTNDMRNPILYALAWPERLASPVPTLDLVAVGSLSFEAPDPVRFPALSLARAAIAAGGEMPAALNAANEMAVEAFLAGRCSFPTITRVVAEVLARWAGRNRPLGSLAQVVAADHELRRLAAELVTTTAD